MQEAQASCGGGSDSPDTLTTSFQFSFPHRPSISLELYNRFQNENMDPANNCSAENSSPMDIDNFSDDASSRIPPSVEDAITPPTVPLSSRSDIEAVNNSEILISKKKNPSKRESTDISSLASSAKKSSSASLADPKSVRIESVSDANRVNQKSEEASSPPLSATSASISPIHRYNSKDLPPFIVQVQSIQESAFSHPLHISRTLSNILPRGILEIRKSGRGKVLVQTNTQGWAKYIIKVFKIQNTKYC